MITELPLPPSVDTAERAMEMARIWIVDKTQHVVISPNTWKEPGNWGIMLVDLAKHVSKAYGEKGYDKDEVLAKIKQAFDAEWDFPTD